MSTPARKPNASTADLLAWPAEPPTDPPASAVRNNQPSDGIKKVVFGGQITEEEAEIALMRKPCSGPKLKEMTGSGIFAVNGEDDQSENGSSFSTPNHRSGSRPYQPATVSQISFADEGPVSSKKPTSIAEVAKQRELSGTLLSESEIRKKQLSDAKCKELSGHDIFAPPSEITPGFSVTRSSQTPVQASNSAARSSNFLFGEETATESAKKIHDQKLAELTGNNIFKDDAQVASIDKMLSNAKLKEMTGNDIFADEKAPARDYFGGIRKPPGGESSIALV